MSDAERYLYKTECFACGSKDNLAVFADGHGFCFGADCRRRFSKTEMEAKEVPVKSNYTAPTGSGMSVQYITQTLECVADDRRKISVDTNTRYGVRTEYDPFTREPVAKYYPYYKGAELVTYKKRTLPKSFCSIGDAPTQFFGQHLYAEGRMLIVTEGCEDALAVAEAFFQTNKLAKAVSVPNGAGDTKVFEKNISWLEKFEKIVLCFDGDDAGQAALKKVVKLLTPGKVYIAALPEKDASDMLVKGRGAELINAIYNAQRHEPGGIVPLAKAWERYKGRGQKISFEYFPGCKKLNEMISGLRWGEVCLYTGGAGTGKTSFFKQQQLHLVKNYPYRVGILHLEESLEDTISGYMSLEMGYRVHLEPGKADTTREEAVFHELFDSDKVVALDYWGSMEDEDLLYRIQHLIVAEGCKFIFLDHISMAISEYAVDKDERKVLDMLMTKLTKLAKQYDVWIGVISHLRKTDNRSTPFELGAVPSLDDLRSSGALKQLSFDVVAISRNQQAEDILERNTNLLTVLKSRHSGRTGPADELIYNTQTGRLESKFDHMSGEF